MHTDPQRAETADAEALHTGAPVLADSLAPPLTTSDSRHPPFRSLELDGLRGIAVALVVLFHTPSAVLKNAVHSTLSAHILNIWTMIHDSGWAGVDLFFALSGFLITRNLLEAKVRPHFYRNFYARRVLRIIPLYLLILALVALVYPHSTAYILLCLVYLANFSAALGQHVSYPVLWSLSIEEHFYLIWPTLIRKLNRRGAAMTGAAVCILCPIARATAVHYNVMNPLFSWYRFDGFMYGALVAILFTSSIGSVTNLLRWTYAAGLSAFAVLAAGIPFHIYTRFSFLGATLLYSCVAALASAAIAYSLARPGARSLILLRNPALRLLGDISYWVYLIHDMFLRPMERYLDGLHRERSPAWSGHPIMIYLAEFVYLGILCFGTGILVRRYIEMPILKLKRYF